MLLMLSFVAILAGCATVQTDGPDEQGYTWRLTGTPIPEILQRYRMVPEGNLAPHCGGTAAISCAVIKDGFCFVYYTASAPAWVPRHERRHCEGWGHPNNLKREKRIS